MKPTTPTITGGVERYRRTCDTEPCHTDGPGRSLVDGGKLTPARLASLPRAGRRATAVVPSAGSDR